jgi:hypothetical protein
MRVIPAGTTKPWRVTEVVVVVEGREASGSSWDTAAPGIVK